MVRMAGERYTGIGLTGGLELTPTDDGRSFRLLRPFRVLVNGLAVEVPRAFETDFASIPRVFWRVLPPLGKYNEAAVIHDLLYRRGELHGKRITQKQADVILLDLCRRLGVPRWQRMLIYSGLRLGGWWTWRKYRKAE